MQTGRTTVRAAALAAALMLVSAVTVAVAAGPAAADSMLSSCAESDLDAAVAGGGTVLFGVDCVVTLTSAVTIGAGLTVNIDGNGHQVTLDGADRTRHFIVAGGSLTLSHLTLRNGMVTGGVGPAGLPGPLGENQNPGTGANGTDGGAGGGGGTGDDAQGGSILITSGQVTLNTVSLFGSTAVAGAGGTGGPGGTGGNGGSGMDGPPGDSGTPATPFTAETDGGPGHPAQPGGKGGNGRAGGMGGTGGAAQGGAIYNAGTLHLNGVTIISTATAGAAGQGGNGGTGGNGATGGTGGDGGEGAPGNQFNLMSPPGHGTNGAEGGTGGTGGSGGNGGGAGPGGSGGAAQGGGVYNIGTLVVTASTISGTSTGGTGDFLLGTQVGPGGVAGPGGAGGLGGDGGPGVDTGSPGDGGDGAAGGPGGAGGPASAAGAGAVAGSGGMAQGGGVYNAGTASFDSTSVVKASQANGGFGGAGGHTTKSGGSGGNGGAGGAGGLGGPGSNAGQGGNDDGGNGGDSGAGGPGGNATPGGPASPTSAGGPAGAAQGGGIYNAPTGSLQLTGTLITANQANGTGGGIGGDGLWGGAGGVGGPGGPGGNGADGGAAATSIPNSSIDGGFGGAGGAGGDNGPSADGGPGGPGGPGGAGGIATGGGLHNDGTAALDGVKLTKNSATGGAGGRAASAAPVASVVSVTSRSRRRHWPRQGGHGGGGGAGSGNGQAGDGGPGGAGGNGGRAGNASPVPITAGAGGGGVAAFGGGLYSSTSALQLMNTTYQLDAAAGGAGGLGGNGFRGSNAGNGGGGGNAGFGGGGFDGFGTGGDGGAGSNGGTAADGPNGGHGGNGGDASGGARYSAVPPATDNGSTYSSNTVTAGAPQSDARFGLGGPGGAAGGGGPGGNHGFDNNGPGLPGPNGKPGQAGATGQPGDPGQAGTATFPDANQPTGQTPQTITFTSTPPATAIGGGPAYTVTATGGGSANPVVFSIDPSAGAVCSLSGAATVSFVAGGTCVIDANQTGNAAFAPAAQVQQAFPVGLAPQTITFTSTPPATAIVGGPAYTVTATGGGSANLVVFSVDPIATAVCSLTGPATISFVASGTCVIDANQAGNNAFAPAAQVQQSVPVGLAPQTITFTSTPPAPAMVGGPVYTVTATGGGSGNPVVFSIDATATTVCSLTGPATISFVAAGTCVIDANQAGNSAFAPAAQVQQSYPVSSGQPPSFSSASSITFYAGLPGIFTVTANGVPTPSLTQTGPLPPGVTFTDNGNGTATLAGSPSTNGTSPLVITASNGITPDATQTFTLTVSPLKSILIAPTKPTIPAGTPEQFTATGLYGDGTNHDLTAEVEWSSSKPAVATISNAPNPGLAQGLTKGQTNIAVTAEAIKASTTLRVAKPQLEALLVNPLNPTAAVGQTVQFAATGIFSDGTTTDL